VTGYSHLTADTISGQGASLFHYVEKAEEVWKSSRWVTSGNQAEKNMSCGFPTDER